MELGNALGFDFQLMDQAGLGHARLAEARTEFLAEAAKSPKLVGVRLNGMEDAPQYQLDIDREKARALGVAIADINNTLSTAWGGSYANEFIDRGRVKKEIGRAHVYTPGTNAQHVCSHLHETKKIQQNTGAKK